MTQFRVGRMAVAMAALLAAPACLLAPPEWSTRSPEATDDGETVLAEPQGSASEPSPATAERPAEEARSEAAHGAGALDWEVREEPGPPALDALRRARDGGLGLLDDAADLQLGLFADGALLGADVLMALSDGVGLLDDNPVTQHVFKAVASKSLARSAYLLHLAGAEAILGSHGMERERYLRDALVSLNPLLDPDEEAAPLPLDPLDFVGEAMLHTDVYSAQLPGRVTAAVLVADVLVRPAANLLRIAQLGSDADDLEAAGQRLVRRAIE